MKKVVRVNDYCYTCGVTHRNSCPKEKKKEVAKSTCPNCEKERVIPKDDYVCAKCREELAPKFKIVIPETKLDNLKDNQVQEVAAILLKNGVGYRVEAM